MELVVEEVDLVDDLAFEESVELLGIDSVGAFDLAVEAWYGQFDVDVVDALVEQVPVEGLPKLGPVVGLDLRDLKRQFRQDVVDELDRGNLVVGRVGAKHSLAGAVVDGGVLAIALILARLAERFDDLHVDLQRVPGASLLVAFPFGVSVFVALRSGQPAEATLCSIRQTPEELMVMLW